MNPDSPKRGPGKKASIGTLLLGIIAVSVVIVIAAVALYFIYLPPRTPDPKINNVIEEWANNRTTYRLFVTVQNNGAYGKVKVFATVKATESPGFLQVGWLQTQDKDAYLDRGKSTTLTFEYNSDYLAMGYVTKEVWAVVS